ncbi:MAG: sensor histidine kinase [Methyloligellaceae bacterium]
MSLLVNGGLKAGRWIRTRSSRLGLSTKLLLLTIIFVMLAEILIFMPSVANFRKNWFAERLAAAQLAALSVEASSGKMIPEMLQKELLKNAQVYAVALKREKSKRLVLSPNEQVQIRERYDFRDPSALTLLGDVVMLLFRREHGLVRVTGNPTFGAGEMIEIVVDERAAYEDVFNFGLKILGLSIVISIITAAMVYFALNLFLVRPMMRLTHNMVNFADNPEDSTRIIIPSTRGDEIGTAERELSQMQHQLMDMLHQKSRLAALGLAVSKINHDLRNMLANATLISDRMSEIKDPQVQRFTPKLISSLDRAIRLCQNTLQFGQAPEPKPVTTEFNLKNLIVEVRESLELAGQEKVNWTLNIAEEIHVRADKDQLYRVFLNLCRNSVQVLENCEKKSGHIQIKAFTDNNTIHIDVADNGPGVPERAREHLFDAFKGSVRKGGTGLGLAISAELVRAHGGKLELLEEDQGTTFRITLPA